MAAIWSWFEAAAPRLLLIGSVVGAAYALISHTAKFRLWLKKRRERKNMLDSLIANGSHLMCSQQLRKEHDAQFATIGERLDIIDQKIEETQDTCQITKGHNARQDEEISQIARVLDNTSFGVYALIEDAVVTQGKNGNLRKAYTRFNDEMRHEALDIGRKKDRGDHHDN